MGTVTGSEVLARALVAQGMETLFFLMGGPMLETESEIIRLGVRAIDTRHEQAAAMEAHAWTRLMRRPGVCMAASGPGTTNLLTGVANAWADAAPLVAVGGSSARIQLGMEAFQEMDQVAVFRPVTKWAERVLDARRIPDMVATAFRQATAGRPGPVYLDLPGVWVHQAYAEHLNLRGKREQCLEVIEAALTPDVLKDASYQDDVMRLRETAIKAALAQAEDAGRFAKAKPHIDALIAGSRPAYQGLGHLFQGAPAALPCQGESASGPNRVVADLNGDGLVNLTDPIAIQRYLFQGDAPPALGTACVRVVGCPAVCEG